MMRPEWAQDGTRMRPTPECPGTRDGPDSGVFDPKWFEVTWIPEFLTQSRSGMVRDDLGGSNMSKHDQTIFLSKNTIYYDFINKITIDEIIKINRYLQLN